MTRVNFISTTKSKSSRWMLSFLKVSGYRGFRITCADGAAVFIDSGSELTVSLAFVLETKGHVSRKMTVVEWQV